MSEVDQKFLEVCKDKLIQSRKELLNRYRENLNDHRSRDKEGDEIDASVTLLEENRFLTNQERLMSKIREIDLALARMKKGDYGVCEETEEPIERDRLLALPWTRLSLEGAEIRENRQKKFANDL